jgi:hypothetical protein
LQGLAFLLIFIFGLIHTETFQNWAAQKATTYLSNQLNTVVKVDLLDFNFFGGTDLKGFYMEDLQGDTMISAANLSVSLESGLWTLLQNRIDIDAIGLQNAKLYISKDSAATNSNIGFVFAQLSQNDKKESTGGGTPLVLNLNRLLLDNVEFIKRDLTIGQNLEIFVGKGNIAIDKFDLANKRVEIKSVVIDRPRVRLTDYVALPLLYAPEDSVGLIPPIEEILVEPDTQVFVATIQDFKLTNGQFDMDNFERSPVKTTPFDVLDFDHIGVFNIDIDIENFEYSEWDFTGKVNGLSAETTSGFVLEKLSAEEAWVGCTGMQLNELDLKTPDSHVGDTLIFKYREYGDWLEFTDRVRMDLKIKNSDLALSDIMVFAPKLRENTFFANNQTEVFEIDGNIKGRVNRLEGRELNIQLPGRLTLDGKFRSRDLTVLDEASMNFDLKRLQTDVATLRQLIPDFNPPENFDKLQNINFNGRFDGFFVDFVADGNLTTNLGRAKMNMRMDLKNGRNDAKYSGQLSLSSFDLGAWSGSDDLGKVSFVSKVKEGRGLTLQTANAKLEATIDSLEFRGYDYRNVAINGQLNQKFFNGDLSIDDENIALDFEGKIDYRDSLPAFDFSSKIKKLDLKALNLTKQDYSFAGDFDLKLTDADLTNIQGSAVVYNLQIIKNQEETYLIDSISLNSEVFANGEKSFSIASDVVNLEVDGIFDIEEIPQTFVQFFERNYPEFANRFDIVSNIPALDSSRFDFKIDFFDTKNLPNLIDPKLSNLNNTKLFGNFDGFTDEVHIDLDIDTLVYDNVQLADIVLIAKMRSTEIDFNLGIFNTLIDGKTELAPITLLGLVNRDTVEFAVSSINLNEVLDNLNLNGLFFLDGEEGYKIQFLPSNLILLNEKWDIAENNYIRIGKRQVETKDFRIFNEDKKIQLNSIGEKGLELSIENVDLAFLNNYTKIDPLQFGGRVDLKAQVQNLFEMKELTANLTIDTLLINDDDWGVLRLDAETPSLEEPVEAYLSLTEKQRNIQVTAEGKYYLPTVPLKKGRPVPKNFFDFDVGIANFPVQFLEYVLSTTISNTVGTVNADKIRFYGVPSELNIEGIAEASKVATTVNFLNTRYYLEQEKVLVDNNRIVLLDAIVSDELGNTATVNGGLTHNHLLDFELDIKMRTNDETFLAMNTDETMNSTFYGRGMGRGFVRFSGPFAQTNAEITATTTEGTNVVIPVTSETEEVVVESFIIFEDEFEETTENSTPEISGLNLEMNLELTQAANVELIFDRQWGDVIKGNGEGNLNILMTRTGEFEMRGNYTINQGNYLFTLMSFGINKPFVVEKGGTIRWNGDPFNAEIDISAKYEKLSASTYNFIQELLVSAPQTVVDASRTSSPVDLKMNLTGSLFNPNIEFDIDFPNLPPVLKGYTEGKLRTIKQNQNELNRQVFGLLISGQFLPTGGNIQAADIGINTLSEMIANQFSIYVTELVSEWLSEDGLISGIDFDFSLSRYSMTGLGDATDLTQSGNEFQGRMKLLFRNDRLIFHAGTNVDWGNTTTFSDVPTNSSQLTGEFMLEYVLTEDRKFRVRVYQRTEPDIGGRRNKYGLGFSFRKEFDSLEELFAD